MDTHERLGLTDEQLRLPADEVFDIVTKIGSGSYGDVYKVIDRQQKQPYAVKKISANTDLREIVKEVSVMQECDSPYIVRYFGSFSNNSALWIVMEFCGVGSVSDMMKQLGRPLPELAIASVLADAIRGLAYLHERKRIHRDIKAGNILLTENGHAKIADFGVAGKLSETLQKFETMIGSPLWMAPEVLGNSGYELPADIWSIGITAIEMAEGKPPLSDMHPIRAIFAIPTQDPPSLSEPSKWSPEFFDFVTVCLNKDPSTRPTAIQLCETHIFLSPFSSPGDNQVPECLQEMIAEGMLARRHYNELIQMKHHSHPQPSFRSGDYWEHDELNQMARRSAPAAFDDRHPSFQEDPNSWLYQPSLIHPHHVNTTSMSSQSPSSTSSLHKQSRVAPNQSPNRPFRVEDLTNFEFFNQMSESQLKRRIEEFDSSLGSELVWLKQRYEAKRAPLLAAIQAKQAQMDEFLMRNSNDQ